VGVKERVKVRARVTVRADDVWGDGGASLGRMRAGLLIGAGQHPQVGAFVREEIGKSGRRLPQGPIFVMRGLEGGLRAGQTAATGPAGAAAETDSAAQGVKERRAPRFASHPGRAPYMNHQNMQALRGEPQGCSCRHMGPTARTCDSHGEPRGAGHRCQELYKCKLGSGKRGPRWDGQGGM
jgi:hypothetical protein